MFDQRGCLVVEFCEKRRRGAMEAGRKGERENIALEREYCIGEGEYCKACSKALEAEDISILKGPLLHSANVVMYGYLKRSATLAFSSLLGRTPVFQWLLKIRGTT